MICHVHQRMPSSTLHVKMEQIDFCCCCVFVWFTRTGPGDVCCVTCDQESFERLSSGSCTNTSTGTCDKFECTSCPAGQEDYGPKNIADLYLLSKCLDSGTAGDRCCEACEPESYLASSLVISASCFASSKNRTCRSLGRMYFANTPTPVWLLID
jgi:hypothetical protein